MSKLKEGTKIIVVDECNEIRKGTVKKLYKELNIAICDMEDGSVEKLAIDRLGVVPNETKAEPENIPEEKELDPEFSEDDSITLTRGQWRKIYKDISVKRIISKPSPIIAMVLSTEFGILGATVEKALFNPELIEND